MLAAILLLAAQGAAGTTDAERVLVVANRHSPASLEIAADYCEKRHVRLRLDVACPDSALEAREETISYPLFAETIERPLRALLEKHPEVDFLVLTKGVPIRIERAPDLGIDGRQTSVDSFLAALGYEERADAHKLELRDKGFRGTAYANNFWNSSRPFSHREFGGYLVTRLDGYTIADAKALVAHALEAEARAHRAPILLDVCASFGSGDPAAQPLRVPALARSIDEMLYSDYNADLACAAALLEQRGRLVHLENTAEFAGAAEPLAGYASWGSNDTHFAAEKYHALQFVPGAIAVTAVSTSARTFLPAEGGQSLIADLVHQGATGAAGWCDEPLLLAISSPTVLFDRYARGFTLAESYYAAARFVGWEDIVLGDPLCRPLRE
jgi:uncharacterized protein (TIGR03790 family)